MSNTILLTYMLGESAVEATNNPPLVSPLPSLVSRLLPSAARLSSPVFIVCIYCSSLPYFVSRLTCLVSRLPSVEAKKYVDAKNNHRRD